MHGALGARRVVLLEGVDEHAVLVDRSLDAPRQRQLAAAHQAHEAAQVTGDAVEPAVGGKLLHEAVEVVVAPPDRATAARRTV